MPRFNFNDEQKQNSYGFKIKTSGISLSRFTPNPVMLDGHNSSNSSVIGKWVSKQMDKGILSYDTDFDDGDDHAKMIQGKIDRGYIKGCSMGIAFKREDLQMINGELILLKCELLECSIVSIPSNANALRLYVDDKEFTEHDMKTLCLSIAQESAQNPEDNNTNKPHLDMKKITLSQLAVIALGFAAETGEMDLTAVNQAILKLSADKDALQGKLDLLEQKEKDTQVQLAAKLIDDAVKTGRITAESKQQWTTLAAADLETTTVAINALPAKQNLSAGAVVTPGGSTVKTMDEFQKLSTAEQIAFKASNPKEYKAIVASY